MLFILTIPRSILDKSDTAKERKERDKIFEAERKKQKDFVNKIIFGFLIFVIGISFNSGIVINKLNSLEKNQYEADRKVELLYMVALKNGDITLDMMGAEIITRGGKKNENGN